MRERKRRLHTSEVLTKRATDNVYFGGDDMLGSGRVIEAMIEYFGSDLKRINHFLKVFAFAKTIGEGEKLDKYSQRVLEISAIVHDIGIKVSEEKYNSSAGKYQELEGPAQAQKLLSNLGLDEKFIDEVCYLVGHHHTYENINTKPYQILVEADFLVNLFEDGVSANAVKSVEAKIFKTDTGRKLLKKMYAFN